MQRTSFKRQAGNYTNKNIILISMFILFVVGMIYGTLLSKSGSTELIDDLGIITKGYIDNRANQTLLKIFSGSFCSSMIFLIIPYLLGFSAIGQIGTALVPIFKGLGLGATMGCLYQNYGLSGIGYSALIIVPQTVIALFAIMTACRESVKLSNLIFLTFFPSKGKSVCLNTIKLYHIKFFILLLFILFSAVIDTFTGLFFSGVFKIH